MSVMKPSKIWIGIIPTNQIEIWNKPFFCTYGTNGKSYGYASNGELHSHSDKELGEFEKRQLKFGGEFYKRQRKFGEEYHQGDTIKIIMEFGILQCSFYKNGIKQGCMDIESDIDYKIAVCFHLYVAVIEWVP